MKPLSSEGLLQDDAYHQQNEGSRIIELIRTTSDDNSTILLPAPTPSPPPPPEELTLLQSIRKWPWIAGYSLALSTTSLLYGFDLAIVGTVSSMPVFQQVFGEKYTDEQWIIPSSWLSLWNASSPLGLMLGSLAGGWLQDRVGRRWTLISSAVISAAAVAICYWADTSPEINVRRGVFFAGKFFQGFSIGAIMCATQTYLSEILPQQMRAGAMTLFPIFKLVGQGVGSAVVRVQIDNPEPTGYRICFASQWPFSAAPIIIAFLLPESTAWLLRKNRITAARRSHSRLETSKYNSSTDVARSFETLQKAIQHEQEAAAASATTYIQCFQGTNLRRTLLVAFANLIIQCFGFSILGNASYFMQTIGMEPGMSVTMLIIGIVLGLVSLSFTFYTLSRFGRRPLSLVTLGGAVILWTSMGVSGFWSGDIVMWYTAVCLTMIIVVVGVGVWPASFAIGAETSSIRLRAKTQGIGWFVNGLGTLVFGIVVPYIYNTDAGALGPKTGWVFAAFTAGTWLICWYHLPEMKDRSPMEIDTMFELKLRAKDFSKWTNGDCNTA